MTHHDYARQRGMKLVSSGKEYQGQCPECKSDDLKFYISVEAGHYICFRGACPLNKGGSWNKFSALYNIGTKNVKYLTQYNLEYITKCNLKLNNTPNILNYIINIRKLDINIVNYYKLGLDDVKQINENLTWPCLVIPEIRHGNVINIDWRLLGEPPPEVGKLLTYGPRRLFNVEAALQLRSPVVILSEGRIDTLSSIILNPYLSNIGLPSRDLSSASKEVELLSDFNKVYLALDMDQASSSNINKLAEQLGKRRCYRMVYPAKDINELLQNYQLDKAKQLWNDAILQAEPCQKSLILKPQDIAAECRAFHSGIGYKTFSTGFKGLDNLTGGFRPGELYTIGAYSGVGKSTLAVALAFNAAKQGVKCLLGSFELALRSHVVPKLLSFLAQKNIEEPKIPQQEFNLLYEAFIKWEMIDFIDQFGFTPVQEVLDGIEEGYSKGYRLIVLDQLQCFVEPSLEERANIDRIMTTLHEYTTKQFPELTILLISHLRKPPLDYKTGKPLRATPSLFKGSSSIEQYSDNIWILNKEDQLVDVEVCKTRSDKTNILAGGKAFVFFNKAKFHYEIK